MKKLVLLISISMIAIGAYSQEQLGRGMYALERGDGSVFISWRMLPGDDEDTAFQVSRLDSPVDSSNEKIPMPNEGISTYAIDNNPNPSSDHVIYLLQKQNSNELLDSARVPLTGEAKPYINIPLDGDYDFQKVGLGDLDGDGVLEYIIKRPDFNTDPYQQPGYWKKSTTTYKLEAYQQDGTLLWRYDMGWAIEAGIWYSPWVVYDVDQDGKAEVYCKAGEGDPRTEKGTVENGPEFLVKLDGETGKVVAKTDWLSREGFDSYNYYSRNFLTVAYLDGQTPSLIMQRGTYRLIKMQALDKDFNPLWYWEATGEYSGYRGQGSHGLISADVDEDGRDELVIGAAVIDDNGEGLWTLGMGHPDECYVADIDPDNPGLEIYYGFETRQERNGLCVVDAKTGAILWGHDDPTRHIHGQGMVGDVLAEYPGQEVYGGERDYDQRWLYSAKGELIEFIEQGPLSPRPLWWDDDPQKEVTWTAAIRNWREEEPMQTIDGKVVAVMDCLGDYREELITALDGELRIYATTIPTEKRRPCLLTDRQYRLGVTAQTMGYYYPAKLGVDPRFH